MLAKAGKYNNCLFHRLVPNFMVGFSNKGIFSYIPLITTRFKPGIHQVLVQAENHIGALPFEMNTT